MPPLRDSVYPPEMFDDLLFAPVPPSLSTEPREAPQAAAPPPPGDFHSSFSPNNSEKIDYTTTTHRTSEPMVSHDAAKGPSDTTPSPPSAYALPEEPPVGFFMPVNEDEICAPSKPPTDRPVAGREREIPFFNVLLGDGNPNPAGRRRAMEGPPPPAPPAALPPQVTPPSTAPRGGRTWRDLMGEDTHAELPQQRLGQPRSQGSIGSRKTSEKRGEASLPPPPVVAAAGLASSVEQGTVDYPAEIFRPPLRYGELQQQHAWKNVLASASYPNPLLTSRIGPEPQFSRPVPNPIAPFLPVGEAARWLQMDVPLKPQPSFAPWLREPSPAAPRSVLGPFEFHQQLQRHRKPGLLPWNLTRSEPIEWLPTYPTQMVPWQPLEPSSPPSASPADTNLLMAPPLPPPSSALISDEETTKTKSGS